MRFKITVLFLLLAAVFVFFVFKGNYFSSKQKKEVVSLPAAISSADIKNKLSSLELFDYEGKKLSLDKDFKDLHQDIIIHLWASWCAPCVNEVPELIAYSKKNHDIKFVIVSLDDNQEDIAKFLKSFPEFKSDKFIKIWDGSSTISKYLNADRLPMSVVLKKDNNEPKFIKSVVNWKTFTL